MFDDGRRLVVHDPRRLARFEIDSRSERAGTRRVDVDQKTVRPTRTRRTSEGPAIKARLLDQSRVAGVGNLLGDEMLFRAGVDPRTPTGLLSLDERRRLYSAFRLTLRTLQRRGGSHLGDHMDARFPGGQCPKDGTTMVLATIGGRTTYWCPKHQM